MLIKHISFKVVNIGTSPLNLSCDAFEIAIQCPM